MQFSARVVSIQTFQSKPVQLILNMPAKIKKTEHLNIRHRIRAPKGVRSIIYKLPSVTIFLPVETLVLTTSHATHGFIKDI